MTTHANPCGVVTTWVVSANTWHLTCFGFLGDLFSFFLYSWDHASPSPADRFWWSIHHLECFRTRMYLYFTLLYFWGPVVATHHLGDQIPQNAKFGGVNRFFSGLTRKILKPAYYQNYCINSSQILHNIKDHQVLLVGGPNAALTYPRWRTAAILEKTLNHNISATAWSIWLNLAHGRKSAPYRRPLKFRIFENARCRRPPSWKSQKSRYHSNGLTNLCKIWHHYAKWLS